MKLTPHEIQELVVLDALCFEPPLNYSYRDLLAYTKFEGAILLREREGERLIAYCLGDALDGTILTLDVHPEYRRRGLGRRLLSGMIEEMRKRKAPCAVSQIAIDNLSSLELHKNLGFKFVSILYDYYPDGSAAWEMELDLSSSTAQQPDGTDSQ